MHVDAFSVNDKAILWGDDAGIFTWKRVALPSPLAPHDSVRLAVDWHYEISKEANREGMIDSTTYYLAYFYPRVAVYDDYEGWDTMDFTDLQEFYSDFNDYDVTIRAPANFVVWGTGTLRTADAVLQPEMLAPLSGVAHVRSDHSHRDEAGARGARGDGAERAEQLAVHGDERSGHGVWFERPL